MLRKLERAVLKIIVINGNSSENVSERIAEAAREAALVDTEIQVITPKMGPATIEGYLDGQLSAVAICEEIAERCHDGDGFVIACFSDPGLYAARDITQKPVVGIAEAAMVTAIQLGHRFGLLTPMRRLKPVLEDLVRLKGLANRLAGVRTVDLSVAEAAEAVDSRASAFYKAGLEAIEEDGAEVLILAGAVLSGMERELTSRLNVPVLDPVKCAVAQIQVLVNLGLKTSHIGGFGLPSKKSCPSCPPEIHKLYKTEDDSHL
jgi:allantoin racemase